MVISYGHSSGNVWQLLASKNLSHALINVNCHSQHYWVLLFFVFALNKNSSYFFVLSITIRKNCTYFGDDLVLSTVDI